LTASTIRDPADSLARKLKRQLYLLSEGRNEEDAALWRYEQLLDMRRAATVDAGRAFAHAQERYVTEQYEEEIVLFQAATRESRQHVESLYFRELQSYKMAIEKLREALRVAPDPDSPLVRKVRRELKQLEGDAWA
jgi:tetratricopeptide (TPR) repeat protein